jgi:hypothetical protein
MATRRCYLRAASPWYHARPIDQSRCETMTGKIQVHDPRGYPPQVIGKRLAPRLEGFDGKKIYLVDCLFDNSDVFMSELKDWFGQQLPGAGTELVRMTESWVDDPDLRARIEADGDAAILGVGL